MLPQAPSNDLMAERRARLEAAAEAAPVPERQERRVAMLA
jgi:hypothetical protein